MFKLFQLRLESANSSIKFWSLINNFFLWFVSLGRENGNANTGSRNRVVSRLCALSRSQMMLVSSCPLALSLYCAWGAAHTTFLHLSAQFSGLACAKMCFPLPWSERVEKEAKPDQFFRGNPWSKLLSQAYVSLALTFGVSVWRLPNAFSDSSAPIEGSSGPYRGWL